MAINTAGLTYIYVKQMKGLTRYFPKHPWPSHMTQLVHVQRSIPCHPVKCPQLQNLVNSPQLSHQWLQAGRPVVNTTPSVHVPTPAKRLVFDPEKKRNRKQTQFYGVRLW